MPARAAVLSAPQTPRWPSLQVFKAARRVLQPVVDDWHDAGFALINVMIRWLAAVASVMRI
jgi:hypothetical protein